MKILAHSRGYPPEYDYNWSIPSGRYSTSEWQELLSEFGLSGRVGLDESDRNLLAARSTDGKRLMVAALAVPSGERDFSKTMMRVSVIWIWDDIPESRRQAAGWYEHCRTGWEKNLPEVVEIFDFEPANENYRAVFVSLSRLAESHSIDVPTGWFELPNWSTLPPPSSEGVDEAKNLKPYRGTSTDSAPVWSPSGSRSATQVIIWCGGLLILVMVFVSASGILKFRKSKHGMTPNQITTPKSNNVPTTLNTLPDRDHSAARKPK